MTDDRNPHGDPNQGNPYQGHPAQNAHQHGEGQQPSAPRDPWSPGAGYHPTTPQGAGGYPGYPQQPGYQAGYRPTEQIPTVGGTGTLPTTGAPTPSTEPRRVGRTALVAGAVALALVSGGIGGVVGSLASSNNGSSAPVSNALDAPKPSTSPASNAPAGSVEAVAAKVVPSVVQIQVAGTRGEGEGSGVILSSDGLIMTNNHVIAGGGTDGKLLVAFSDGSTAPATLVGTDPTSDIAVIKVDGKSGLTPIELGSSEDVKVGEEVVAIGSPLGLAGTVTAGIVSALDRPVSTSGETGNQNTVIDAIQTDAAINPGNSGGALVNMEGQLVGINTAIATAGGQGGSIGLGFAIPVDQARRIADELVKTGKATQAIIGVQVAAKDATGGATVVDVTGGGPAEKAGIPKGAVVTKVDDRVITSGDALIAAIRSHAPGDKVSVTYKDPSGNSKTVDVELGTAPTTGGR
ncbi:S1C family serine protease [Prescottella equi]|uniref:PDZ domain-containing protein n=1 Tax=Rhodococcus hoagii TaxID=43767 RepID=A0AAP2AJ86_RHOHA|nr:trypsin-like peptidase domain-containing protein [Prescottella equi]MBU4615000.1 trypsin-like peptidase domain-containing protein [Rhodococcus sp. GG48]ERN46977.1 serine peptidase [Prescottella equi NBRC 101255 = C 7]MBM4597836.1 PDZ domain-containing protein [Prescottella equi]MBM4625514.1 PDZ domain-containing protein [Prescottella equi]NKS37604.1 PDZ domain-containing protein [Prescottella equi]